MLREHLEELCGQVNRLRSAERKLEQSQNALIDASRQIARAEEKAYAAEKRLEEMLAHWGKTAKQNAQEIADLRTQLRQTTMPKFESAETAPPPAGPVVELVQLRAHVAECEQHHVPVIQELHAKVLKIEAQLA